MAAPVLGTRHSLYSEAITTVAGNMLFGYLSATTFMTFPPFAGGVFGGFAGATFSGLAFVTQPFIPNSTCLKTIYYALLFLASIAVATAATTLCGYSLTFSSGLFLTASMILTTATINALFACALRHMSASSDH
ncbi:MAG: hypothetical protein ACHQT8_04465 [Chlamydiales bacterium]